MPNIETLHTHLSPRPQDSENQPQIPYLLPNTRLLINEFDEDADYITSKTITNTDLIPIFSNAINVFNDFSAEHEDKTFLRHLGVAKSLSGDVFEFVADTYLRETRKIDEEIVSPAKTDSVYHRKKFRQTMKNQSHSKFDLLTLENKNGLTFITKGYEVTTMRSIMTKKRKRKQLSHHENGQCIEDMMLGYNQEWTEMLGEIFNGQFPHLPKKVAVNHAGFSTALILPELEDPSDIENGIEDYAGEIIRAPLTRTDLTKLIDALTQDLDNKASFRN